FFFQAEDGIRDFHVTGVQTCALPIYYWLHRWDEGRTGFHRDDVMPLLQRHWPALELPADAAVLVPLAGKTLDMHWLAARGHPVQIGRASCRERLEISVGGRVAK